MWARGIESEAAWRPVCGEAMRRCGCALGVTCGGGTGCEWATTLPEPARRHFCGEGVLRPVDVTGTYQEEC